MTYEGVVEMLEEIRLPYAYYEFPDDTVEAPPFICFYYPANSDFLADSSNYQKIEQLTIELYTDNKDLELEGKVEAVLKDYGLTFSRTESCIDAERMFMITYETEVLING